MLPLFREMGLFSAPETAVRAASSSSTLVSRLTQERRLIFHQGCVNTVSFHNDDNGLLISGSDDTQIAVWRWQTGEKLHSFDSHHAANVFQAKSIPTSGFDIVSAGADGDILLHSLHPEGDDNTTPRRLFHHNGAVHKLALLPHDQSVFLSCGEDGVVNSYDLRAGRATVNQLFACRHTHGMGLCSVHVNPARPWQFCVAGHDIAVRIFDLRMINESTDDRLRMEAQPICQLTTSDALRYKSESPIVTSAVFSKYGEILASYNDGDINLFSTDMVNGGKPEAEELRCQDEKRFRFGQRRITYYSSDWSLHSDSDSDGDSGNARCAAGMQGSHSRRGWGWRPFRAGLRSSVPKNDDNCWSRTSTAWRSDYVTKIYPLLRVISSTSDGSGHPTPHSTHELASLLPLVPYPFDGLLEGVVGQSESDGDTPADITSESDDTDSMGERSRVGVAPETDMEDYSEDESERYSSREPYEDSTTSSEHQSGDWVRGARWEPLDEPLPVFRGHRNQLTIKGVNFLGANDEWIVSGSDCGYIYIWDRYGKLVTCMPGDAEVVNCIEPHPRHLLVLATSGIEHDIKIWSPIAEDPVYVDGRDIKRGIKNQSRKSVTDPDYGVRELSVSPIPIPTAVLQRLQQERL